MVTKFEMMRQSLDRQFNKSPEKTPWYLSKNLWDFAVSVIEVVADLFRSSKKPVVAVALDTVVKAVSAPVPDRSEASEAKIESILKEKLRVLSHALAYIQKETPAYMRINAQIDLLGELIHGKSANG